MEKKTLEMALLLDFYGELLTEKQREYIELYYNEDFSLAEIAQLGGITRQGVRDAIVRGTATLEETERKTGLLHRFGQVEGAAERIRQLLGRIEEKTDHSLAPLFGEIYGELDRITGEE